MINSARQGRGSAVASVTGDFDGDGDVDGYDFLEWQRTDGTPSGLAAWQGAYGTGSLTAVTAVPEPNTALLVFSLMGSLIGTRVFASRTRKMNALQESLQEKLARPTHLTITWHRTAMPTLS